VNNYKYNIQRKCVMLVLHSKGPYGGGTDKEETNRYLADRSAVDGAKIIKVAWPSCVRKEWNRAVGGVRSVLERETCPYAGPGTYITSQAHMLALVGMLEKVVQLADGVADDLAARFDELLAQAAQDRNALFDRSDYPVDAEHFRRQFLVEVRTLPVAGPNVLIDMCEEEAEILREDMAREAGEAREALLERIAEPLMKAVFTLGDKDKIFRDSLIGNIKAIAELAPHLNITGDTDIDDVAREIGDIGAVVPDSLRNDEAVRKNVADKCEEILKKMRRK